MPGGRQAPTSVRALDGPEVDGPVNRSWRSKARSSSSTPASRPPIPATTAQRASTLRPAICSGLTRGTPTVLLISNGVRPGRPSGCRRRPHPPHARHRHQARPRASLMFSLIPRLRSSRPESGRLCSQTRTHGTGGLWDHPGGAGGDREESIPRTACPGESA